MPDIVMTSTVSRNDASSKILEMKQTMGQADQASDGFSDSDDTSDEEDQLTNAFKNHPACPNTFQKEKTIVSNMSLRNGFYEKGFPLRLYRGDARHLQISTKSTLFYRKDSKTHINHDKRAINGINNQNESKTWETGGNDSEIEQDDLDDGDLEPIKAGQCKDDEHVPIMSLPPPDVAPKFEFSMNSRSFCHSAQYAKALSYRFLTAGEKIVCKFSVEKTKKATECLLENEPSKECICTSVNCGDDWFGGWEPLQKAHKMKVERRRKSVRPSWADLPYNRLIPTYGKDPVIFHHYKESCKYIEKYRFYHTVNHVGRPQSYRMYGEKMAETDSYYSNGKSNLRAMNSRPTFSGDILPSQLREKYTASAPVSDSARDKRYTDCEDGGSDDAGNTGVIKHYSVKDRGKALNLAPVRECTVPDMRHADKLDIVQLNKYLNLTTPPSNGCLQFEIEENQVKKIGNRVANTGDNNLFPACSPRKGARPLRLGSAEFVKPGTADSDSRRGVEKRSSQRSATLSPCPPPGTLIIGSTVTSQPKKPRVKSGSKHGKGSPYFKCQKEQLLQKYNLTRPQTPPQQVSGQRCTPCERVTELSSAQKERSGRFNYTHAQNDDNPSTPLVRSTSSTDLQESYPLRERMNRFMLDINHLGIRGTPFKQSEEMVLYRNRRAAAVKS